MEKRILINSYTVRKGGGKTILYNLLKEIVLEDEVVYVLVSEKSEFISYQKTGIKFIEINKLFNSQFFLPLVFQLIIPILIKKYKINKVFNLCDAPIKTNVFQVFYFDWAFQVYPEKYIYKGFSFKEKLRVFFKKIFFERNLSKIDLLIVQTTVIEKRLINFYGKDKLPKIEVIPIGKPENNASQTLKVKSKFFKILCLSNYYKHKNLEILIEVAALIKKRKLPVKIYLTLQYDSGYNLINMISKKKLENSIENIGPIKFENLQSIYSSVDASILPTLIESFSGVYIESMCYNKPILTSDLDFAKNICNDAALYFDPFDSLSIINKIEELMNESTYSKLVSACKINSNINISWPEVTRKILDTLK